MDLLSVARAQVQLELTGRRQSEIVALRRLGIEVEILRVAHQ
jgi:hypothetical protein